jgi:hypothetical protein
VGLAYAAVGWSRDPTSGEAVLWTTGVAVASLAAIGRGAAIAVTDALSPLRYVFRTRPASSTAAMLFAPAAVALALLIHRAPFDGIAAHGKPLAELITDLACIAASLICLIGGSVALRGMWNARGDERHWKRSLQN